MSDSDNLARAALVLGLIVTFAVLLSPGNPAWTDFENAIRAFPTFDNPFDEPTQVSSFVFLPGPLHHAALGAPSIITTGCSNVSTSHWSCVRDFNGTDGNGSHVSIFRVGFGNSPPSPCAELPPGPPASNCRTLTFDLEGSALPGEKLKEATVDVWCRTTNVTSAQSIFLATIEQWDTGLGAYVIIQTGQFQQVLCPVGAFQKITLRVPSGQISGDTSLRSTQITIGIEMFDDSVSGIVQISTVRFQGVYQRTEAGCTGADFFANLGCRLGSFGDTAIRSVQVVINGIVFIGAVISYLVGIPVTFFGLFNVIFGLGAPAPFQQLIDVAVVALLVFIIFSIVRQVRGSGIG